MIEAAEPVPSAASRRRSSGSRLGPETSGDEEPIIVVLDGDRDTAKRVGRVMRVVTQDVRRETSVTAVMDQEFDLLLVNYDALDEEGRHELTAEFAALQGRGNVVLYSTALAGDSLGALLRRVGLTNIIASNCSVDPAELLVTARKLLGADLFHMRKYLAWGAKIETTTVRRSSDIEPLVDQALAFAKRSRALNRLAVCFANVTDELVANAVYGAPRDPAGNPLFAHLSRKDPVELPGDAIDVHFGCDGVNLAVGVSDPYGALTPDTVVRYLAKCFAQGADLIDDKARGAGLGLYCAYASVSQLVINLAPGRCTEAIGVLDIRGSFRDFTRRGKSLNIFVDNRKQ